MGSSEAAKNELSFARKWIVARKWIEIEIIMLSEISTLRCIFSHIRICIKEGLFVWKRKGTNKSRERGIRIYRGCR